MSWSDDIRCLYCDGKLPLYRKITNGQFCSPAHSKAYWQEQERLAVERLHQTHHSLRAYRPPAGVSIEAILGPPVIQDEPAPEFGGLIPLALDLRQMLTPPEILASDSLAVEMFPVPQWLLEDLRIRDARGLSMAILMRLDFSTRARGQGFGRVVSERGRIIPVFADVPLQFPASSACLPTRIASVGLMAAARMLAHAPVLGILGDAVPLECSGVQPVYPAYIAVSSKNEELQPLSDEQVPHADKLLPIPRPAACEIVNRLADDGKRAPIFFDMPPQFPAGRVGFLAIALKQAGLYPISLDRIPLVQGAWIDNLRAIESNLETPRFILATPVSRPRLRRAVCSPYQLAALENRVAAAADLQPAGFSTGSPGIALAPVDASRDPSQIPAPGSGGLLPLTLGADTGRPGLESIPGRIPGPRLSLPVPEPPSLEPMHPGSKLEPLDAPARDATPAATAEIVRRSRPWAQVKVWALAVPVVMALSLYAALPKSSGIPRAFEGAVNTQFANVRRTVLDRAAVALNEDFRAGLDNWSSRDGAATDWSFDSAGFVRPGPLALYRPSLGLTDYQMQFLGLIDKKALSWVVRAADFRNYYVVKLVVLKAGPLPSLGVTRYAVVNGRPDSRVDKVATLNARADTLYRVDVDVRGDTFLLTIQGQIVDNWSEPRLKHGGVGLFSAAGEASRVRWVQVLHQYDVLGRLCAYLAPFDFQMTNGSWQ